MSSTENNLTLNIEKAIRKAKTLLKHHSADWFAVISVYRNGFVTMNTNAPGAIDQQICKFGVEANAEPWGSFRVGHQDKEITVKKEAEFIVSMLKSYDNKEPKKISKFSGMTDDEIESKIKAEFQAGTVKILFQLAENRPDYHKMICELSEMMDESEKKKVKK